MRNIRQNLFLAFVYNGIGVPVAAGCADPLTGTLIGPVWASAAMTLEVCLGDRQRAAAATARAVNTWTPIYNRSCHSPR